MIFMIIIIFSYENVPGNPLVCLTKLQFKSRCFMMGPYFFIVTNFGYMNMTLLILFDLQAQSAHIIYQ